MRKSYTVLISNKKNLDSGNYLLVRNSLNPEQDPDSDFWLDPDSMNMDPKHWII